MWLSAFRPLNSPETILGQLLLDLVELSAVAVILVRDTIQPWLQSKLNFTSRCSVNSFSVILVIEGIHAA